MWRSVRSMRARSSASALSSTSSGVARSVFATIPGESLSASQKSRSDFTAASSTKRTGGGSSAGAPGPGSGA